MLTIRCATWVALGSMLVLVVGCKSTVNLTARNYTTIPQNVRVVVKDADGLEKRTLHLGTVSTQGVATVSFKAKEGNQLLTAWGVPGSADLDSDLRSVGSQDPMNLTIDLTTGSARLLDDREAVAKISSALSLLGPNRGYQPKPLKDALASLYGALIIFTPPKEGESYGLTHYRITPANFSSEIQLGEFEFPDNTKRDSVEITSGSSGNVGVSVPVYGSLEIDTQQEGVYRVKYDLERYGGKERRDPPNWDLTTALTKLAPQTKKELLNVLKLHPDAKGIYVTTLYVVKRAHFEVYKAQKLTTAAKASGASVVTASGAWEFASAMSSVYDLNENVLNYGGIIFDLSVFRVDADGNIPMTFGPLQVDPGSVEPGTKVEVVPTGLKYVDHLSVPDL
jgi:hypothetical protein